MEGSSWGVWFDQSLEVGRGSSIDHLVCQYHRLESDAGYYREPVEAFVEAFECDSQISLKKK